ncbi:MAG: subclass B3 metallo-beta-lactamase [Acidobacteria bacterium]|nr:subclass B3 metallo-beta-lactamase [Acidobacteriota bacterium]
MRRLASVVSVAAVAIVVGVSAQTPGYLGGETSGFVGAEQDAAIKGPYSEPAEPFKILGNIYYVGAQNISSYLITTPEGHILFDTGMPQMHDVVRTNIETLGFQLSDIEIIISSHAHVDHVGGHAEMQRATGASIMAMGLDAQAIESGMDISPVQYHDWPAAPVARVLEDGDTVSLGGTTLRAMLTAGHTPGATTWVTNVEDGGRFYNVVFPGGRTPNGGPLVVGNPDFPDVAEITLETFSKLRLLNPDILLPGHPQGAFEGKIDAMKAGVRPHPLLETPGDWARGLEAGEANFRRRMEADRAKTQTP